MISFNRFKAVNKTANFFTNHGLIIEFQLLHVSSNERLATSVFNSCTILRSCFTIITMYVGTYIVIILYTIYLWQ